MVLTGLHGLIGMALYRLGGKREWALWGLLLGSLLPDVDHIAKFLASLFYKLPSVTFPLTPTHSLIFAFAVSSSFYAVGLRKHESHWKNLAFGLGVGMLLHILVDIPIWFDGGEVLWPLPFAVNAVVPASLAGLINALEFLFFAIYLWNLAKWARKFKTDLHLLNTLRTWIILEMILFLIFASVLSAPDQTIRPVFDVFFLVSSLNAFWLTLRMRTTIGAQAAKPLPGEFTTDYKTDLRFELHPIRKTKKERPPRAYRDRHLRW